MSTSDSQKTPLYDVHVESGAKMVDFAGWVMPVRYGSELAEHHAVRQAAGLFDVSHMGEIRVHGEGAEAFLQGLTPNNVARLKVGQAHYSALLTPEATYVDDLLIYRLAEAEFLLVVNASNIETDFAYITSQPHPNCEIENHSDRYALLALQGPLAESILSRLTDAPISDLKYYWFLQNQTVGGRPALISRTGYTGEEGFELYLAPADAAEVWRALIKAGADDGLVPCGLGARDTLRLEAAMALYGHEIDSKTTPYEAGLGWTVKLKKGDFIGRDVLAEQKASGVERKLVGFELLGKGIARQGYAVLHNGETVGEVCSGTLAPTLQKAIGTAYVPTSLADEGTELEIQVRKRVIPARLVPMPFYKRP